MRSLSSAAIICATVILLCVMFAFGCTTPPEPGIITKTANVAVPTPCKPDLGPRPELMTKDQLKSAVAAASNFDDRVKVLTAQVLLYIGWVPVIEAGLKGCEGVPPATTNAKE